MKATVMKATVMKATVMKATVMKATVMKATAWMFVCLFGFSLDGVLSDTARADVQVPSTFGSHMVLQQGQPIRVWGRAEPGEEVTVTLGKASQTVKADEGGKWRVELPAIDQYGGPHEMVIRGNNTITLTDILVGEVWLCSGQSNMEFSVSRADDGDLEQMTANYPRIRLLSVPKVGTQEPQGDFNGKWEVCTSESVGGFSAVGYLFGRTLYQVLDVPIGLIDNSWGGSACEAWIRRDLLEGDAQFQPLMQRWEETERNHDLQKIAFNEQLAEWKKASAAAKASGKPQPQRPRPPRDPLSGQHRPANLYNGVLHPLIGLGLRGAIWYQGESNAGRAYQYRDLFPLMIQNWRDVWERGDFSFYWVQLADFKREAVAPVDSAWAELREAQTMAMSRLSNTGQAVIVDVGEGRDIHPRDKEDVALRLARWALAKDYGRDLEYRSPEYARMTIDGGKAVLEFDHVGQGLYTFDVAEPRGFVIAGKDKKFVRAQAKLVGKDRIEVWSDEVAEPVAVRYAWADNPVCNVYSSRGKLPLTPFRTDDWPGVTAESR